MAIINCIVRKEKRVVVHSNPKYLLSLLLLITYIRQVFLFDAFGDTKQKSQKYETAKYNFEFINTISNKWKHVLSNNVGIHIVKNNFWTVGFVSI